MNEVLTNNNENLYESAPGEMLDKAIEVYNELPIVFRIISVIGWVTIEARIIENKQYISCSPEGLTLCTFCINAIEGDNEVKISKRTLHLGTECLKSLQEISCSREYYSCEEDRMRSIRWWRDFLEVWREYLEECLNNEGRLIL